MLSPELYVVPADGVGAVELVLRTTTVSFESPLTPLVQLKVMLVELAAVAETLVGLFKAWTVAECKLSS